MRIALAMLIRPVLALAVVATAAAIGLSRLAPPAPGRTPQAARHVLISRPGLDPTGPGSLWLDRDTGATTLLEPPDGRYLQHGSLSPWLDESGQPEVVGLLLSGAGDRRSDGFDLARVTFPDGRVLDRVGLEAPPSGFPCWYPGTRARVLFCASDETLYRYDFEPPEGGATGVARDMGRPRPIRWGCIAPGGGAVRTTDPCWPTDPRFARIILVGLRLPWPESGRARYSTSRIWWLRLNPRGDEIVEAGPILDVSSDTEARSPSVGPTADGGLALAYFTSRNSASWDLRVSPLTFDESGRPRPLNELGPRLAGRCLATTPPTFSTDGRWLTVVRTDGPGSLAVLRLDLATLLSPTTPASAASAPPTETPTPPGKWSPVVSAVQALFDEAQRPGPRGRTGEGL